MMEGYGDRDSYGVVEEEKKPLVKRGCSAGRIMNCCIAFDYFLIMLTALIVSGVLGVLNNKVNPFQTEPKLILSGFFVA